jgi:hypothetical protein
VAENGGVVVFTTDDARAAVILIGIDLDGEGVTLTQLAKGMNVELEHGTRFPDLDVTGDDPVITAKIALAHLREFADYYERLEKMEAEAESAAVMAFAVDSDLGIG